ncbi:hypothetical protein HDU98_000972 [Podochytrium sp. JEL0797]|nr:hypothetical protein HDU98_000972 [Podochytrium sp. JEL0797]
MSNSNVQCSNQATFNLCYSNWQGGGTISICASQPQGSKGQNECLCQQYFQEAYCYNSFCPQDPTTSQINSLRSQYCSLVPNFNPNNNFGGSTGVPTQAPVTTNGNGLLPVPTTAGSGGSGPVLPVTTAAGPAPSLTLPAPAGSDAMQVNGMVGLLTIVLAAMF